MPTVPLPEVQDAERKQQRLDAMQRVASALLVFVSVLYVVSRVLESRYHWLAVVRAVSEASMVGAIADWFAVTALFRHPLGIPIPHTAIIPMRKDRIGRALGGFVQNNFLAPALLETRIRNAGLARKFAEWLRRPENARTITRHVAKALSGAVAVLRDDDVHALLEKSVIDRVRATPVAPAMGNILTLVTASNRHQELLDDALVVIERVLREHEDLIRERLRAESAWWVPDRVDDKIHNKIVGAIAHTLQEISKDPAHPLRARFDAAVHRFIDKLRESPDVLAKGEELKEELLAHPGVREFTREFWADAKAALVRFAEQPDADDLRPIERGIVGFADSMLEDPALLAKVDGWILDATLYVVAQYREEAGQFIAETVSRWDPADTSRKIELSVGRDLQFIRINGTIMGAVIGLLLYLFGLAIG
jgi:uncharacterized membrane-anchored protein YjiN (DUF445 family)